MARPKELTDKIVYVYYSFKFDVVSKMFDCAHFEFGHAVILLAAQQVKKGSAENKVLHEESSSDDEEKQLAVCPWTKHS